MIEQI
jgi:hypothetical protein